MSDDYLEPMERLARFTLEHKQGKVVTTYDAISSLDDALHLGSDDADEEERASQRNLGLPTSDDVTSADALGGLALIVDERKSLDRKERAFIEAYMDRCGTWPAGAEALGYPSGGALRSRYRRLGGTRTWPAGRPSTARPIGLAVVVNTYDQKAGAWIPRREIPTSMSIAEFRSWQPTATELGVEPGTRVELALVTATYGERLADQDFTALNDGDH